MIKRLLSMLLLSTTCSAGAAVSPVKPDTAQLGLIQDPILPLGRSMHSLMVRGAPLDWAHGIGDAFGPLQAQRYRELKDHSQTNANFRIQWVLMNLDRDEIIARSRDADQLFYGASVSKLYVGASLLDKTQGSLSAHELQDLADMIVISSNQAWAAVQKAVGDGNDHQGQLLIQQFAERLGHIRTRAFRGWNGKDHGNEVNAIDMAKLLSDTYHKRFHGAEILWNIMHATRTGGEKARRYLPQSLIVGGKTGTYRGPAPKPDTQKAYQANVHHHAITFAVQNTQYALVVLSDQSSDEDLAIIAGGLVREYLGL